MLEVQMSRGGHMWLVLRRDIWTEQKDLGDFRRWGSENRWGGNHVRCQCKEKSREEPKVVPRSQGVRFGIVRVVERIKGSSKDRKVRGEKCFWQSYGYRWPWCGKSEPGCEDSRPGLRWPEEWPGGEEETLRETRIGAVANANCWAAGDIGDCRFSFLSGRDLWY